MDDSTQKDSATPPNTPAQEPAEDRNPLSDTDIGLIRVLEDLIDVLIRKGTLQFTELPEAAQAKLLERRTARAGLQDPLRLLDPEGDEL